MTRIHSIYNRMWCGILLLGVACSMAMSCADDYYSENEGNDGRMATLSVQFPKAGTVAPDSEVRSARFIAFQAGGAGISGVLQVNSGITLSNARIQIPVGNSNIYIIANAPEALKLDEIRSEEELRQKTVTWETAKALPHVMVESYRNVNVTQSGVKDASGNTITIGKDLKRVVSRLTVNLQYQSQGGMEVVFDSVTVGNRAAYSLLLPRTFDGSSYVPQSSDRVKDFTATGTTTDGTTAYQPLEFYLSEYLVDEAHQSNSTCLFIHAHQGTVSLKYPVYIGDWFGTGITYDDFKNAATPARLVGIEGLGVTRNKHYTLTCKLKGKHPNLETSVEEWTVVDITGDINTPYINFERTEVLVNPLKANGTSIAYTSSVSRDKISVDIIENPDNRFSYVINDRSINFIHSLNVSSITDTSGKLFTGKALVTVVDGSATIKTEIKLGVFNPISKFYVRGGALTYEYGTMLPATAFNTKWQLSWREANGYSVPYKGVTPGLYGKNPTITMMNGAIADNTVGCGGYWEGARDNRQTGIGCWRLPTAGESVRLMSLLINLRRSLALQGYDDIGIDEYLHSLWTSNESSAEYSYMASKRKGNVQSVVMSKVLAYYARCIRDIDNTSISGGSSYLILSHNNYEIAPLSFRTTPGVVPIYYESDGPVSISLMDENGNDISNMGKGMPFVGFSAGSEEELFKVVADAEYDHSGEPPIAFPNKAYSPLKKGYFCLHSTVRAATEYFTSLGNLNGPKISDIRKNKYTLLFKAGNLSKSVLISFVNPLATANVAGTLSLADAMGINDTYAGYDYWQGSVINASQVNNIVVNVPVPDRFDKGCGGYYEGSPTDNNTGVGNWYLAYSMIAIGGAMAANAGRWGYTLGNYSHYNDMYGPGLNFSSGDVQANQYFWTTRDGGSGTGVDSQSCIQYALGASTVKLKTTKNKVRCERRLNADILTFSTRSLVLSPGQSAEILYYTNVKGITSRVLYVSGDTTPAFTTTTTTTGRIKVSCLPGAKTGTKANLLVETVGGMSTRSKTYKIINLTVK